MQTSQAMECKTTSRMIGDTRRAHSAQRGFTLIELIIGVVIVSLLLALGIPSFKSWVLNAQIRDGAEAICAAREHFAPRERAWDEVSAVVHG